MKKNIIILSLLFFLTSCFSSVKEEMNDKEDFISTDEKIEIIEIENQPNY